MWQMRMMQEAALSRWKGIGLMVKLQVTHMCCIIKQTNIKAGVKGRERIGTEDWNVWNTREEDQESK